MTEWPFNLRHPSRIGSPVGKEHAAEVAGKCKDMFSGYASGFRNARAPQKSRQSVMLWKVRAYPI
jgi:hypothetical protein